MPVTYGSASVRTEFCSFLLPVSVPSPFTFFNRISRWCVSITVLVVFGNGFCFISDAQTAHFSGAQSIVPTSNLNQPIGVAIDGGGNIYITDSWNGRVLKETLSGGSYTESTVATVPVVATGAIVTSGIAVDEAAMFILEIRIPGRCLKRRHPTAAIPRALSPVG